MIRTRTTFNEVKLYAVKSYACACGKKLRRRKKFCQTLNPFNKNVRGQVKTREEISLEIAAEAKTWRGRPDPCTHGVRELGQPGGLRVLPCAPDKCQECAGDHKSDDPHNAESMFYQYKFYAKHGRFPGWKDAMSHCSKEVQEIWTEELKKVGAKGL